MKPRKHRYGRKHRPPSQPGSPGRASRPSQGAPAPRPAQPPHGAKPQEKFVEGKLQLRGKFGFVLSEQPGLSDVYVAGPSLRLAMEGDRVLVRVTSGSA